jgi:hypothetical protein
MITKHKHYLEKAVAIGSELLTLVDSALPLPYIGLQHGQFDQDEVFIDSISSIYPVFASLALHSNDQRFLTPIRHFLDFLHDSISEKQIPSKYSLTEPQAGIHTDLLDIPFRVYSDIARIHKILPDIDTKGLLHLPPAFLNRDSPLTIFGVNEVFVYSVEACSVGSYIHQDHPVYSNLVKKCDSLLKNTNWPRRLSGSSEFGNYDLQTGFAFEGELIELFWRESRLERARSFILNSLSECRFGSAITGIRNTTSQGKRSDNWMHPELFSRWILNGALIESGIKFEDVTLSEGGHILQLKPPRLS